MKLELSAENNWLKLRVSWLQHGELQTVESRRLFVTTEHEACELPRAFREMATLIDKKLDGSSSAPGKPLVAALPGTHK